MSKPNSGIILQDRAREIVHNVDKYFEAEKQQTADLLDHMRRVGLKKTPDGTVTISREIYTSVMKILQNTSKVTERTQSATGINKNTVTRIRREAKEAAANGSKLTTPIRRARGKKIFCKSEEIAALNDIINSYYTENKEMPSLQKLLKMAKEQLQYPGSKTTLRLIVNSLKEKDPSREVHIDTVTEVPVECILQESSETVEKSDIGQVTTAEENNYAIVKSEE